MATEERPGGGAGEPAPRVPAMQDLYDNIWVLFLVSLLIVLVSYIIWGLIDMLSRPVLM